MSLSPLLLRSFVYAAFGLAGTFNILNTPAAWAHDPNSPLPTYTEYFRPDALTTDPKLVHCTLSDGSNVDCVQLTLKIEPADMRIGPWCPRNTSDTADRAGKWIYEGDLVDLDGEFITSLDKLYGDSDWKLYSEETGDIHVTETLEGCMAAARPDVDETYQNYCVECALADIDQSLEFTFVIPVKPIPSKKSPTHSDHDVAGISFNGTRLEGPAPVDAILAAHTIAAFDDCGGHVNPHVGYHLHAVVDDCLASMPADVTDHSDVIGVAMDGYMIHARADDEGMVPEDLDMCGGHETPSLGYHYHAGAPGSNAILGCHMGATGCQLGEDGQCLKEGPDGGVLGRLMNYIHH